MFHTLYKIATKHPQNQTTKMPLVPTFSWFNEHPNPQYYTKKMQMYNAFKKLDPNIPNTK